MIPVNPHLLSTATPPIPEAQGWATAYPGHLGPLIDLSQAVPGYPPHPDLLARARRLAPVPLQSRLRPDPWRCGVCAKPMRPISRSPSAPRPLAPADVAITTRLQPGFLRYGRGAGEGWRRDDSAAPLVLQSQDDARHARHRGATPAVRSRPVASSPIAEDGRAPIDAGPRAIVLIDAEQSDGRRLPARGGAGDLPALPRARRGIGIG